MAYTIGSQKGQEIANNMKSGDTYKASDGSTWTKNSDGSVSVTSASGNYTANAYQSPSTNTGGGNSNNNSGSNSNNNGGGTNTQNKGTSYNIGSALGISTANSMKDGDTYNASDGTVWTKTNGQISVAKNGVTYDNVNIKNSTGSYAINTDPNSDGAKKANSMQVGETWVNPTDNSVWYKNADGSVSVTSAAGNYTKNAFQGTTPIQGEQIKLRNGMDAQIVVNTDGTIKGLYDTNGNALSFEQAGGMLQYNGKQYLVTRGDNGSLKFVNPLSAITALLRRDGDNPGANELVTQNGEKLTADMLIMGEDGHFYTPDGERLTDVIGNYTDNPMNYVFQVGDKYFDANGKKVDMGIFGYQAFTEDQIYDMLLNQMKEYGMTGTPKLEDFDVLTYDQAKAQAAEQLNNSYNKQLNNKLSELDQRALETGFYGQLPTEALREQAAASNELDRETAINELARELLGDSRGYQQTQFNSAMQTSQQRTSAVKSILEYIMSIRANQFDENMTQKEYNRAVQSMIDDAVKTYTYVMANGGSLQDAMSYAKGLYS